MLAASLSALPCERTLSGLTSKSEARLFLKTRVPQLLLRRHRRHMGARGTLLPASTVSVGLERGRAGCALDASIASIDSADGDQHLPGMRQLSHWYRPQGQGEQDKQYAHKAP